ncbi:hypothetical protein D9M70_392970 [compost metagenome]
MDDRRSTVITGDHARRLRQQFCGQPPVHSHPIEQSALVEANHLDNRLDKLAVAELKLARLVARNGSHTKIKTWSCGPIQVDLPLAGLQSQLRRGEIDIGKLDGPFHLKSSIASEKNMRDMSLDVFDRIACVRLPVA